MGSLLACATANPVLQDGGPTPEPEVVASWEEGCEDERSLVLLCQEDGEECGFFQCHEVVGDEEVLLASRGGGPLHSKGPRGGLWNQAWLDFKDAKPNAFPEEIYRHSGALIFRFELTGPIVPYAREGR